MPPSVLDAAPARRPGEQECAAWVDSFADQLVSGDATGAEAIAAELIAGGAGATVVLSRLVQPAMELIGTMWERSRLTVADEHLAMTVAQQTVATVYEHLLVAPTASRGRVLLAAAEGERHGLGLRMVADVLDGAGYEVLHLGVDVPNEALLAAVARHRPAIVGLSVSLTLAVPAVQRAVDAIIGDDPTIHLIIGGAAAEYLQDERPTVHVIGDVAHVRAVVDTIAGAAERSPHRQQPRLEARLRDFSSGDRTAAYDNAMSHAGELARLHARRAQEFRSVALHDALTGLWNRRAFDDRVLDLVADPSQAPVTMLMLDIDRFKQVNDVHGHQVGDQALRQVAERIQQSLRPTDFAARLGGDEFVVLLPLTSLEAATEVAERIRSSVEDGAEPPFTVSIGVKECYGDIRASILAADTRLYQAKGSGRNTVCALA